MERALETASRMNQQAKEGDMKRNHVNCGALSEIMYMLTQLGFKVEDCTYADGDYYICDQLKADGITYFKFEN